MSCNDQDIIYLIYSGLWSLVFVTYVASGPAAIRWSAGAAEWLLYRAFLYSLCC